MEHYELLIVGAGAGGMAAALAAEKAGVKSILLAERNDRLGGILNQCLHQGFGLGYFREDITGVEYARRFAERMASSHAEVLLSTAVLSLRGDKTALLSTEGEVRRIAFDKCILATGSRERTINSLMIAGSRPSGVMTAGMAQSFVNLGGYDVGDDIIILGSGDIGQIMARRFTLHGKRVKAMIEQNSTLGGLLRNRRNCIEAYNIPVILNATVDEIIGERHVEAVVVRHLDTGERERLSCSTLVIALGLIPERELCRGILLPDGSLPEWITLCGNCDYIHDIVDSVTTQAEALFP